MSGWLDAHFASVLEGLATASTLFMLSLGLSLVFGILRVLNLAHGTIYLAGAFVAWRITEHSGGLPRFLLAALVATVLGAVGGLVLAGMLAPLGRRGHLDQALLTLGVAIVGAELLADVFGDDARSVPAPPPLDRSVDVFGATSPTYRLALIVAGVTLAIVAHVVVERTGAGAIVRATAVDRNMVAALGVDPRKVRVVVLAVGCGLAALAGALASPVTGPNPGLDQEVLLDALVVVVLGGVGSVTGTMVGALVVGQIGALGPLVLPDQTSFLLLAAVAVILVVRPRGLVGRGWDEAA